MNTQFELLPGTARIWVYQSSRLLSDEEVKFCMKETSGFIENWTAHQAGLKAGVQILHNMFLVIGVDENYNDASGCSIDKKVNFMKQLGNTLQVNFFDRMNIAYEDISGIHIENMHRLTEKIKSGNLPGDLIVYNNLVHTKQELTNHWRIPLKESWLNQMVN